MTRSLSTNKYLLAAGITAAIFLIGFFLGLVVEGKRVIYVDNMFDQQKLEFSSSQLQYAYLSDLDSLDACPAIFETFYNNLKELDQTRVRLEAYVLDSKINDASFELLKRAYVIEQIRYWLLSEQAQDTCGEDLVRVLYFYSDEKECPDCANQAFVLNYLKGLFNEKLLIFALDSQFEEEPMIEVLKKRYDVQEYPTVIIGDKVISGYESKNDLLAGICAQIESEECSRLDGLNLTNSQ